MKIVKASNRNCVGFDLSENSEGFISNRNCVGFDLSENSEGFK